MTYSDPRWLNLTLSIGKQWRSLRREAILPWIYVRSRCRPKCEVFLHSGRARLGTANGFGFAKLGVKRWWFTDTFRGLATLSSFIPLTTRRSIRMDNQRRRQIFQGAGFFWFLETSWYYVNPKGWREMVKFAQDFPQRLEELSIRNDLRQKGAYRWKLEPLKKSKQTFSSS